MTLLGKEAHEERDEGLVILTPNPDHVIQDSTSM